MNNYCIKDINAPLYFRGWGRFGEIVMDEQKQYAHRMSRTLAERTIPKIEKEKGIICKVEKVS